MKPFKLILTLFAGIAMSLMIGSFAANAMEAPEMALSFSAVVFGASLLFSISMQPQTGVLNSLTIAAVLTEWGALYRAGSASVKDLMVKLMVKAETEALFARRVTDSTIMEKSAVEFARVLQRFQKDFTPIGGATFVPSKIPLWKLKIDAAEYPDDLEESWLGFLADNNLDRKQWPFTKWYQIHLLAQAAADYEKHEIFGGVPADVVAKTANAAGTNVLGIRKQLNDYHAAGKTITLTMGAIPTDPVECVEYFEDMAKLAADQNEELFEEIDSFNTSKKIQRRFKEGMRTKYNMNYAQTDLITIIDTDIQVRGFNSHKGSDKIWATPAWNRQAGIKKPKNESVFQVESEDRKVKFFTDFYKGVGFWIPEYLIQNDVDLV